MAFSIAFDGFQCRDYTVFSGIFNKRIESASFISYIQGDTRQARFGCLGIPVHVGARVPPRRTRREAPPPPSPLPLPKQVMAAKQVMARDAGSRRDLQSRSYWCVLM